MEQKSSTSTELASMTDRNISGFITYNRTRNRKLRQSIGARVTETAVPERCGGGSSSKGIVCGYLRSTRDRKMDDVQWPEAITPCVRLKTHKKSPRVVQKIIKNDKIIFRTQDTNNRRCPKIIIY
jgi:hypothetical protein